MNPYTHDYSTWVLLGAVGAWVGFVAVTVGALTVFAEMTN